MPPKSMPAPLLTPTVGTRPPSSSVIARVPLPVMKGLGAVMLPQVVANVALTCPRGVRHGEGRGIPVAAGGFARRVLLRVVEGERVEPGDVLIDDEAVELQFERGPEGEPRRVPRPASVRVDGGQVKEFSPPERPYALLSREDYVSKALDAVERHGTASA